MKNIARVDYTHDNSYTEQLTEDCNIYFCGSREEEANKKLIEAYYELIELYPENELTIEDIRKNDEEKGLNYVSYYCGLYDICIEELNDTDIDDILSDMYMKDLSGLINSYTELRVGTVGYSPWSYYITINGNSHQFINDIWNGYNIYDTTLIDEEGDCIDSITEYIESIEEATLNSFIRDYFGCASDIYYVKNDLTSNFSKLVKEVTTITYNYMEV